MLLKLTAGLYAKYRMLLPFRRHKLISFTLKKKKLSKFRDRHRYKTICLLVRVSTLKQ